MAVFFLYHLEHTGSIAIDRTRADASIGMFHWNTVIIDQTGELVESTYTNPLVLKSINEALRHPLLSKLHWVWLHPRGERILQDYAHPLDNVIYCVGSDITGFSLEPVDLPGDVLRIATPDPDGYYSHPQREFHAATVLPIIIYDRFIKMWR